MILQRSTRARSAWRPFSGCATSTRSFHASIALKKHEVPGLDYQAHFEENGVEHLMSKKAFEVAWTRNMAHLVNRLNKSTAGSDAENATTKQLAMQYAHDPRLAPIFNAASLAHNNHFFFSALSPAPNRLEDCASLHQSLTDAFGSIEALRKTMLTMANAMYAPGYVWLVAIQTRGDYGSSAFQWRVMATYNTGTPYPQAHRTQNVDVNTEPQNEAGSFGAHSRGQKEMDKLPLGAPKVLTPVLCVSTWEHAYLTDYGPDGKQAYLMDWWKNINWAAVDQKTPLDNKRTRDLPFQS